MEEISIRIRESPAVMSISRPPGELGTREYVACVRLSYPDQMPFHQRQRMFDGVLAITYVRSCAGLHAIHPCECVCVYNSHYKPVCCCFMCGK